MDPIEQLINNFTNRTNFSIRQTHFVLSLLNNDLFELIKLEIQIKNCHISYCPETIQEIEHIKSLIPKTKWFKPFEKFRYELYNM